MKMPAQKVELHPKVYEGLEQSRLWYEERTQNLGMEFLDEVSCAIEAQTEFLETKTIRLA